MDVAMPEVLRRLRAAPIEVTHAAIRGLDGRWWDSKHLLPEKSILLRRNFNIGPEFQPWLAPGGDGNDDLEIVEQHCRQRSNGVLNLRYPTVAGGEPMRYLVRVEVRPAAQLLPFVGEYQSEGGWISQEDFPAIVRRIHTESNGEFGPAADRP
jgi:hypothetical protein